MKRILGSVLLVALFGSCNNSAETPAKPVDSMPVEVEVINPNQQEVDRAAQLYQPLFTFFQASDSTFDVRKFNLSIVDSLTVMRQPLDEAAIKPYLPYLIFNADSTKAIDLHSYNTILVERNGKTVSEAAGPDTEIALIDFKSKTRQRLLFAGPSFVVHDGSWVNEEIVSVAGGELVSSELFKPEIWFFDLRANTMKVLGYNDTLNRSAALYKRNQHR